MLLGEKSLQLSMASGYFEVDGNLIDGEEYGNAQNIYINHDVDYDFNKLFGFC